MSVHQMDLFLTSTTAPEPPDRELVSMEARRLLADRHSVSGALDVLLSTFGAEVEGTTILESVMAEDRKGSRWAR